MCLGIPGKVIEIRDDAGLPMGKVDFGGVRKEACLAYIPEIQLGDYVIVHVGFAISRVDEEEALKTLEILATMGDLVSQELATMGPGMERADRGLGRRNARVRGVRRAGRSLCRARRSPPVASVKYLDEYRDPVLAKKLVAEIHRVTTRPWTLMEVCGGQTHTIVKQGIDEALPEGVRMIHGPGCPVCVTPLEQVDKALAIAARPDVIFTSYGDMLRVPGSSTDLLALKARGADVRIVYSPLDALKIALANPGPPGRLLRGRLRDDRTGERDGCRRGRPARHRQLQRARLTRPGPAGDDGAPRLAEEPGPGVPRRRPRVRRHGLDRVRADRREVPACRSSSPASSRSTSSRGS